VTLRKGRQRRYRSASTDVGAAEGLEVTAELIREFLTGYQSVEEEGEFWLEDVEGEIPVELQGTLFRNGPGKLEIGGVKLNQPFDGDGMVSKFCFKGGRCFFQNMYIRTREYVEETEAGKPLYRGAFSQGNPSGGWFFNPFDFSVKNVSNTGVICWGGKLYTLHESSLPMELDPRSLKTLGSSTMDGVVKEKQFAAHYRIDQRDDGSRRLFCFTVDSGSEDGLAHLKEVNELGELICETEYIIPGGGMGFYHDAALSEHFYVLFENPTRMDLKTLLTKYMIGRAPIASCIKFDTSRNGKVHLIPRPGAALPEDPALAEALSRPWTFEVPSCFVFHHANAFEVVSDSGVVSVVLDTVRWPEVDFSRNMDSLEPKLFRSERNKNGELYRMCMSLPVGVSDEQTEQLQQAEVVPLNPRNMEFPIVAPSVVGRPHRFIYTSASPPVKSPSCFYMNQTLCKTEVSFSGSPSDVSVREELWWPGEREYVQEPIFVPKPGGTEEDSGWLLAMVYNAEILKTELIVLDAAKLSAGPVTRLRLPFCIPYGLHGSWEPRYLGPASLD